MFPDMPGQQPFEPPSVFGWKGACNINRAGSVFVGEAWMRTQPILNRSRGCIELMNMLNWMEVDFVSQLGLSSGDSAQTIIQKVASGLYDLNLSADQMSTLLPLLTLEFNDDGSSYPTEPRLDEDWYVRRKITRLVCLLGGLS